MTRATGPEEDRMLVEYLLGRLTPDEQAEVEERAFVDDAFEEQLEAAADDLIHAYLAGALPEEDRGRFESHFLGSPRQRERLAFVKDLLAAIQDAPAEEAAASRIGTRATGWPTWALWAAAAVVAALAAGLLFRQQPPPPPQRAEVSPIAPSAGPPTPALPVTPSVVTGSAPATRPASPERTVRLSRQAPDRPAEVRLSPPTRVVRVEVPLDDPEQGPAAYDAVLRKRNGGVVWRATGLSPSAAGSLVLAIPARLLAGGDYLLRVAGEQLRDASAEPPAREFALRVVRDN